MQGFSTVGRFFTGAALVALAVAPAAAQTRSATTGSSNTFGVKGGIVSSTLDLTVPNFIVSADSQIGLTAGIFMGSPLAGPIHLDIEALITTKGARYTFGDELENELRVTYLEVPVLARVGFGRVFVSGGPSFAFKLKEVQKEDGEETIVNDDVKKSDIGVAVGGGVSFGRWIAEARYTLGLINIADVDGGGFAEPTAKNRTVAVMFGYRWK